MPRLTVYVDATEMQNEIEVSERNPIKVMVVRTPRAWSAAGYLRDYKGSIGFDLQPNEDYFVHAIPESGPKLEVSKPVRLADEDKEIELRIKR